jgi:hypothetical protein
MYTLRPYATTAHAHAVVGDRVFPATLTVDARGAGNESVAQFGHNLVVRHATALAGTHA